MNKQSSIHLYGSSQLNIWKINILPFNSIIFKILRKNCEIKKQGLNQVSIKIREEGCIL